MQENNHAWLKFEPPFNFMLFLLLVLLILGMEARHKAIFLIHAANLIKLGRGESDSSFQTSHECKLLTGRPATTGQTTIGGYPKVVSYDVFGEKLYYSSQVKHA